MIVAVRSGEIRPRRKVGSRTHAEMTSPGRSKPHMAGNVVDVPGDVSIVDNGAFVVSVSA
ncbi:hypothetical protein [Silanimonas sp.]|uniref:hypothetical protein n=1 Tax=Silanimonas sp. TaxID=1929290 RepID=UPI0022BFEF3A|nr:hypothetical protein [Silanimonas sp.]MCZ8114950.1 hypothetical protein [Silanimonas sp.]